MCKSPSHHPQLCSATYSVEVPTAAILRKLCKRCHQVPEGLILRRTLPASQLKRFCRWSVCPVGPAAQEKNHLIIFYFFLTLTPNHCNTSEQMPGKSEAAVRSWRVLRAEPPRL